MNPFSKRNISKLRIIILSLIIICNVSFSQISKRNINRNSSYQETELEFQLNNPLFLNNIAVTKTLLIEIPDKEVISFDYDIVEYGEVDSLHPQNFIDGFKISYKGIKEGRNKNYAIIKLNPAKKSNNKVKVIKKVKLKFNFGASINENLLKKETKNSHTDYVKIKTSKDGIYRVYGNDLKNIGVDISQIKVDRIKLSNNGIEKALYISAKSEYLKENDFIEFTGNRNYEGNHRNVSTEGPYNEYLNRYTDTSVYILSWDNTGINKRTKFKDGTGVANDTLQYLYKTIHIEKNNWFDFYTKDPLRRELPFWSENKTWIEGTLGVGKKRIQVKLENLYNEMPVYIYSKFMDFASSVYDKAHLVSIKVNNDTTNYDLRYINKFEKAVLKAEVKPGIMDEGINNIFIHSYPTKASVNSCFYDWTEIEYPSKLTLVKGFQKLTVKNVSGNYLLNFSNYNGEYRIWKNDSVVIAGVIDGGNIKFNDSLDNGDYYYISQIDSIKSPVISYRRNVIDLKIESFNVDYTIITSDKFYNNAIEYAQFVAEGYKVNTRVVLDKDIYDSYSYGYKKPEAIRDFLKNLYYNLNQTELKFILLVGDASYDYYNNRYKATGVKPGANIIPSYGAPVSDSYLGIWDSSYIPNVNIGRLPVETIEEFQRYFERHKNYISQPYNDWNKRFLLFSGGNINNAYELNSLKGANDFVKDLVYENFGGEINHFYKTKNPLTGFGPYSSEYVNSAISKGALFISYLGHSGTQTWDNSITSPEQLLNDMDRYPLVTDFGCSTAKFGEPDITSFSELFTVKENSQAIAYIGNSALGFLNSAISFPKIFYNKLLTDTTHSICEILNLAKLEYSQTIGSEGSNKIFLLSNTFIGDPVVKLKLPKKPNLVIHEGNIISEESYSSSENNAAIKIMYYNYGSKSSETFRLLVEEEYKGTESILCDSIIQVPDFEDSIFVYVPIKEKPGQHILKITLDKDDKINEIYENDNMITLNLNVSDESYRLVDYKGAFSCYDSVITIIKPFSETVKPEIILSNFNDFRDQLNTDVEENAFAYKVDIRNLTYGKRYWLRILNNSSEENVFTFKKSKSTFSLFDSLSYANTRLKSIKYISSGLVLDSVETKLFVSSAGFIDGNSTVITLNGEQLIPENTLRGHHVCVFQRDPLKFIEYKRFDLFDNRASNEEAYRAFLSSLDSNYIVAIGITDEGRIYSQELKNEIKTFGSAEIDNISFRDSWAFIGIKGVKETEAMESLVKMGNGRAKTEKVFKHISDEGEINIGPINSFSTIDSLRFDAQGKAVFYLGMNNLSSDSILFKGNIEEKGLLRIEKNDISNPLQIKVYTNDKNFNLNEITLYGKSKPEVVLNKSSITALDKIDQGEELKIKLSVANLNSVEANDVNQLLIISNNSGFKDTIFNKLIDIPGNSFLKDSVYYNTSKLKGSYKLEYNLLINDYYSENNFSGKDIFVKGDSTRPELRMFINDDELYTGNYITTNPVITVELRDDDKGIYSDTSLIRLTIDGKKISNSNLNFEFNETNPKLKVSYNATLDYGNHEITVEGKDQNGNKSLPEIIRKEVIVSEEGNVFDLFNYPNPFADETYFTFSLSKLPENLLIKIFTISGRLINELEYGYEDLRLNFNKVYWNGRDKDSDEISNGVYLAKMIFDFGKKKISKIIKLAKVK